MCTKFALKFVNLRVNLHAFSLSQRSRFLSYLICNGNRTEWSPIRSVIKQVITKSDDYQLIVKITISEKRITKL